MSETIWLCLKLSSNVRNYLALPETICLLNKMQIYTLITKTFMTTEKKKLRVPRRPLPHDNFYRR